MIVAPNLACSFASSFSLQQPIIFMFFILSGLCAVGVVVILIIFVMGEKSDKNNAKKSSGESAPGGGKMGSKYGKKNSALSVKKFTANCDFGGQQHPVTLYIGSPKVESHPLQFQSTWLSKNRGGAVPTPIMDSFSKIAKIAEEKHVAFPDLCQYVVDELNSAKSLSSDAQQASEFQNKRSAQKLAGDKKQQNN